MKSKNILIISHANERSGAIDRFEEYLLKTGKSVTKLSHPLDAASPPRSQLVAGSEVKRTIPRRTHGLAALPVDFWISLKYIFTLKPDVIIGANNFDALAGILGKLLIINYRPKLIYFASDLSENRFKIMILNMIYGAVEKVALGHSDYTISNTHRAAEQRIKTGLDPQRSVIVPNAAASFSLNEHKTPKKDAFIYVGALNDEHGVLDFLRRSKVDMNELVIIGDGSEREPILEYCRIKNINVTLTPNLTHDQTLERLAQFNGFGIAPYRNTARYIYYGSSLKLYEYLACGLPVITSGITEQAIDLKNSGIGIVYNDYAEIQTEINQFDAESFFSKVQNYNRQNNAAVFYDQVNI